MELTDEEIDEIILAIRIRTHVEAGTAFVDRRTIERAIYRAALLDPPAGIEVRRVLSPAERNAALEKK